MTDHDYWDRVILDVTSNENDPLALGVLNDEIVVGGSRLVFATDFRMPGLPAIE